MVCVNEVGIRKISRCSELVDMPWRILSHISIGFIGHVARYVTDETYISEQNTAPIHIN